MSKKKAASIGRRDFFRKAGLGTGAAVAALATTSAKAEAPASGKSAGYRETEHVKKFYELARF